MEDQRRSEKSKQNPIPADPRGATPRDGASLASIRENVSEAIRILGLRRWHFLIPLCLGTVLATTASLFLPRLYTASTMFERVDDEVLQKLPRRGNTGAFQPFRETLKRDAKSPEVMGMAVRALGLTENLPKNPDGTLTAEGKQQLRQIGARLASCVSVGFLKNSDHKDLVRMVYTGPDPDIGASLLDAMREAYISHTQGRITRKFQENKTYFEDEAAERRKIVDAIDLRKVQRELDSPTIDPTKPDMIFIKLTSLDNEQRELARKQELIQSKLLKTKQYVESIVNTASIPPDTGVALGFGPILKSPRVRQIEAEIGKIDAQVEKLKITRQMTDLHPEIVHLRELRQRYVQLLAAEQGSEAVVPNRELTLENVDAPQQSMGDIWRAEKLRAEMDIVALKDELERVGGALRMVDNDIAALEQARGNVPQARRAYRKLQEELKQAEQDYSFYSQATQEYVRLLEVDEDQRGIRFIELGPAVAQTRPISPKSKSILILSLLIGIGAGVALVLLAELFDRSYHTGKQVVQSLGLNLLESVDEIITSKDRARRFRRRFIYAPTVTAALLGAMGVSTMMAYLSLERPHTYERLMQQPRNIWQRYTAGPQHQEGTLDEVAALAGEFDEHGIGNGYTQRFAGGPPVG